MATVKKSTGTSGTAKKSTGRKAPAKRTPSKNALGTKVAKTKSVALKTPTRSMPAKGRDPKGGLTAAGRAFFRERDGLNLRPGVTGKADTPDKMKRKGSFLTRSFTNPRGPMLDDKGEPTRLALSAHAWGEPVPKTDVEARKLAAKGRKLLEQFHAAVDADVERKPVAGRHGSGTKSAKNGAGKQPGTKSRTASRSR